jgi:DNA-binding transcriptional LysR family regulator
MDRLLSMRVFQQVADAGSFAAAARQLDLSPAAVTRLVVDLEEHLGTRLMQRTTRRLSLTEAGHTYLGRVRHILQDIDEADGLAQAHTQEMRGVLRIHAPPVLAVHILAPLVAGFRQLHPGVVFDIDVDAPDHPAIEDHDITLMGADASFDGNVIARPVVASHGVLVAAASYVARNGQPQQPPDLSRHLCLRLHLAGQRPTVWRLQHATEPERVVEVPVQPVLWANHTDTLLRATHDGAGICAAPLDLVAANLCNGQLVRVLPDWVSGHYTVYAAMPSRRFVPRRTHAFLDYLTEHTRANLAKAMRPFCETTP